jgi:hypothetical protein
VAALLRTQTVRVYARDLVRKRIMSSVEFDRVKMGWIFM